ncbi:unnamed protein product [Amoebophrya sp. A25]|nr:unnamed protein product [Amoebophrya sp. A25]|eukprot:GSA25T00002457001.1
MVIKTSVTVNFGFDITTREGGTETGPFCTLNFDVVTTLGNFFSKKKDGINFGNFLGRNKDEVVVVRIRVPPTSRRFRCGIADLPANDEAFEERFKPKPKDSGKGSEGAGHSGPDDAMSTTSSSALQIPTISEITTTSKTGTGFGSRMTSNSVTGEQKNADLPSDACVTSERKTCSALEMDTAEINSGMMSNSAMSAAQVRVENGDASASANALGAVKADKDEEGTRDNEPTGDYWQKKYHNAIIWGSVSAVTVVLFSGVIVFKVRNKLRRHCARRNAPQFPVASDDAAIESNQHLFDGAVNYKFKQYGSTSASNPDREESPAADDLPEGASV